MKGSVWAIFGHSVTFGGGAPVFFQSAIWPSSSVMIADSIFLASALRSAGIDFGIAHPQISSQFSTLLLIGPPGNFARPTLPATLDFAGSLKSPQYVVSATVKAASPTINTALASLRP